MAIIRACSYECTIQTPEDANNYSSILVTFQQDGTNLIEKSEEDVTITDDGKILVQLDQSETKLFACGRNCYLQVRCYKSQYEAPGSSVWGIMVYPALNDEVLPPTVSA